MKHLITLEVDNATMFDMVVSVGDCGADIGVRLAGVLLAPQDISTLEQVSMAVYGVFIKSVTPIENTGDE